MEDNKVDSTKYIEIENDNQEQEMDEGANTYPDKEIQIDKADRSLKELYDWYKSGDLKTDPEWQRGDVWNNKRRSLLIESFFMGFPIPVIYLFAVDKEKYEVVDGVQRLRSVFLFMDNEYALSGLESEAYKHLNRKKFDKIPPDLKKRLQRSTLRTFELPLTTSKDLLFVIFQRLNTGGMRLNPMEIRNCIYPGNLNRLIKELAESDIFTQLVKNIPERMADRLCVLRFLAFFENHWESEKFKKGLSSFMNDFCKVYQNLDKEREIKYRKKFNHALNAAKNVFGNDDAFKFKKFKINSNQKSTKINTGLFQCLTVVFAEFDSHQIIQCSDAIKESWNNLKENDTEWIESIKSSNPNDIKKTFNTWKNCLREIMKGISPLDSKRAFTRKERETLYEKDPTCQLCKQHIPSIDFAQVDHIIPYAQGGQTVLSNARLVHSICNNKRK